MSELTRMRRRERPPCAVPAEVDALLSLLARVRRRIVTERAGRRERLKVVK